VERPSIEMPIAITRKKITPGNLAISPAAEINQGQIAADGLNRDNYRNKPTPAP